VLSGYVNSLCVIKFLQQITLIMEDYIISSANNPDSENVDLAYTYMKDNLEYLDAKISNLRSRAATFLGFSGLLLRFIIELSDSQPSYKLTKLLAFLTCFCSIALLGWTLKSNPQIEITAYMYRIRTTTNIFLECAPVEAKKFFIEDYTQSCENFFSVANEIKNLLNISIICLVFSAFFFAINGILVTFLGK